MGNVHYRTDGGKVMGICKKKLLVSQVGYAMIKKPFRGIDNGKLTERLWGGVFVKFPKGA
jgi:hypothetical protein